MQSPGQQEVVLPCSGPASCLGQCGDLISGDLQPEGSCGGHVVAGAILGGGGGVGGLGGATGSLSFPWEQEGPGSRGFSHPPGSLAPGFP